MSNQKNPVVILIAEDDDDDYLLITEAFKRASYVNKLHRVKEGEELMEYLLHTGQYVNVEESPKPNLILLDLNMPKKDGRDALKEIKSNPLLRMIPVVVLTTSDADKDVLHAYDLGVNSFIRKPVFFEEFINTIKVMTKYWFEIVSLPNGRR